MLGREQPAHEVGVDGDLGGGLVGHLLLLRFSVRSRSERGVQDPTSGQDGVRPRVGRNLPPAGRPARHRITVGL
ncbi:hypothetical protein GCM10009790_18730 [Georgenia ruanii]